METYPHFCLPVRIYQPTNCSSAVLLTLQYRRKGGKYKEKAAQQQQRLWDYLQEQKLKPLDIVQVGLLTDLLAEETMLMELQVRV